ncbi:uncharacterized protein FIBRA_01272 [Fibroporia radiculosa]|uniref:Borealin N-terminal domain-containing protein n=1 Tax=Fibroporia radiculosa TaxID=599839 RepID=J4HT19_9APHY|nr:uncharacterized protein FIBRA_01272 [Fibroporia radiculosa]CCL99257.1 predicted protein [Fibroporia radiculosa]
MFGEIECASGFYQMGQGAARPPSRVTALRVTQRVQNTRTGEDSCTLTYSTPSGLQLSSQPSMLGSPSKRRYSAEEKQQLLANLDLEVEHRTRQLEEWLADTLQNFLLHQEGQISRIPRIVRDITLREFAKYDGNVQECVKGLRRELLGTEDTAIDPSTRKRKWVASQDTEDKADAKASGNAVAGSSKDAESSRGVKSARTMTATPKKKAGPSTGPGTAQRARFQMPKTPNTIRTAQRVPSMTSPSPHKIGLTKPSLFPRHPTYLASPSKLPSSSKPPNAHPPSRPVRPPSSSTFNPMLPPSQPRWPRRDESMLSINGSPLANPYQLGLNGYLQTVAEGDPLGRADSDSSEHELPRPTLQKKNSIIVRSSSLSSQSNPRALNGLHSRTNSQSSVFAQSHTSRAEHSSNSHTNANGAGSSRTNNPPDDAIPPEGAQENPFLSLSALVSVPTKDGHVLEFDPLRTSPEELDALEGISDGAKKQAKEDMARLIQAAVERWKIS